MSNLGPQGLFSRFASALSEWSGRPLTFALAMALVALWAVSGPVFDFSGTWQLVINTLTTIVTFLMVFTLQNSQNRDGKALQAKIDELIRSSRARNEFVGIEKLDEQALHEICTSLPDPTAARSQDGAAMLDAGLAESR